MYRRPVRAAITTGLARRGEARSGRHLPMIQAVAIIAITAAVLGASRSATAALPAGVAPDSTRGGVSQTSSPQPTSSPATTAVVPPAALTSTGSPSLPECRYADDPAAQSAYSDWQRTIVDTISRLPAGYVPPDLVPVARAGLPGGGLIRALAIPDLRALAEAARKAGAKLAVQSAYRSEASQRAVFAGWVRVAGDAEARRFSARPGHSEHQLGTAIDFRGAGAGAPWNGDFSTTPQAAWLAANAWRFGWLMSYPTGAQAETCYSSEPWHYRYVGRAIAAQVHASGLSLRAWLWGSRSRPHRRDR